MSTIEESRYPSGNQTSTIIFRFVFNRICYITSDITWWVRGALVLTSGNKGLVILTKVVCWSRQSRETLTEPTNSTVPVLV